MSPPSFYFSVVFFFNFILLSLSSFPLDRIAYHINCGGTKNTSDKLNTTWLSDRFYTSGLDGVVSEPLRFSLPQEKTLRYFPVSSGKKNCYVIPNLPSGRYFIRTFTVYDNYDGKSTPPSFDVSVEGTVVFSWRYPWPEDIARSGAYADLFSFISDSDADVCFYSIATDSPVIASLELIQVHLDSYIVNTNIANDSILVNYGRFSSGLDQWGPGFTDDTDIFGRSWQSELEFRPRGVATSVNFLSAGNKTIKGTDRSPNYFPMKLYQKATSPTKDAAELVYLLPVDAKMDYLLMFHFAEIDKGVTGAGQRVFNVVINGENASTIDVYKEVGSFVAYDWPYIARNLSTTLLRVSLVPVVGIPIICGLENYAIIPADPKTDSDQVIAMKALKESFRIPDRMGWNGDPCAPTSWDAWEGVTCRSINDGSVLVVSQIDLGSQGLKGYISNQISLLRNLVILNLTSNSLEGMLPSGLGQKSLVKLDLSNNKFSGPISESLTSSSLQAVLLNDNSLEGRVPEEVYSVAVRGGVIDLSGNKALCGGPSLPDCSLLWENGGLSTGGRVGIGLSCVVVFCTLLLVIYMCCIRKGRNDYDFTLPKDLISLAAKRNKYHRQKSLMQLEMESQHARGFIPTYNSK